MLCKINSAWQGSIKKGWKGSVCFIPFVTQLILWNFLWITSLCEESQSSSWWIEAMTFMWHHCNNSCVYIYYILMSFVHWYCVQHLYIEGILPKGPYLPCVSMAGRALLAGYHHIRDDIKINWADDDWLWMAMMTLKILHSTLIHSLVTYLNQENVGYIPIVAICKSKWK